MTPIPLREQVENRRRDVPHPQRETPMLSATKRRDLG